jgi:hypothetical protein
MLSRGVSSEFNSFPSFDATFEMVFDGLDCRDRIRQFHEGLRARPGR